MTPSTWPRWRRTLRLAARGLWAQRSRSALGALGVAIGVGAVIAIVAVGEGARRAVLRDVRDLGLSSIVVRAGGEQRPLRLADLERLRALSSHIVASAPRRERWGKAATDGREVTARWVGSTPELVSASGLRVAVGRFLAWPDGSSRRRVCVLGAELARELFPFRDPLGAHLRLDGEPFRVVGVLEGRGAPGSAAARLRRQDLNRELYLPIELMAPVAEPRARWPVDEILLEVASPSQILPTARLVRASLASQRQVAESEVIVPLELLEKERATRQTLGAGVGAMAALALLVGGVGIMNVMLATVTERTREIGVRRAVGATAGDIARQFLVEATLLTFAGGVVGVGTAGSICWGLSAVGGWPLEISPGHVFAVLLVSAVWGVLFGAYPAWRAAAADPIEALRWE